MNRGVGEHVPGARRRPSSSSDKQRRRVRDSQIIIDVPQLPGAAACHLFLETSPQRAPPPVLEVDPIRRPSFGVRPSLQRQAQRPQRHGVLDFTSSINVCVTAPTKGPDFPGGAALDGRVKTNECSPVNGAKSCLSWRASSSSHKAATGALALVGVDAVARALGRFEDLRLERRRRLAGQRELAAHLRRRQRVRRRRGGDGAGASASPRRPEILLSLCEWLFVAKNGSSRRVPSKSMNKSLLRLCKSASSGTKRATLANGARVASLGFFISPRTGRPTGARQRSPRRRGTASWPAHPPEALGRVAPSLYKTASLCGHSSRTDPPSRTR